MKQLLFTFLSICLLSIAFFSSCCSDCDHIECQNGGVCNGGICDCTEGWGGDNCQTAISCSVVTCGVNQTCVVDSTTNTANCECLLGWASDATGECSIDISTILTGGNNANGTFYTVVDSCNLSIFFYSAHLYEAPSGVASFYIEGWGGFDAPIVVALANVIDSTHFVISEQTNPNWGLTINGATGTFSADGSTIVCTYTITFADGITESCTMTMTRI